MADAEANGVQQGVQGMLTGTVVGLADPEGQWRVQVNVPALGPAGEGLWARMANGYASGNSVGMIFMPEIGDEVVIGLLGGDTTSPVILGSLYSAKRPPPFAADVYNNNNRKAIVTRSRLGIEFDEEAQVLRIRTAGGQFVTLDDPKRSVTLQNNNDDLITLSPEGMTLHSNGNLTIKTDGVLTLDGAQGVSIRSQAGDVSVKGESVTVHAYTELKATGGAIAELSSSMETTVRGALVKIN